LPFVFHFFVFLEVFFLRLTAQIKNSLTHLFTATPPKPPPIAEALRPIIEAETQAGHALDIPAIQQLTGWNNVTMASNAPALGVARSQWAAYQQALEAYQRKQAKRQARQQARQAPPVTPAAPDPAAPITVQGQTMSDIMRPLGKSFSELSAEELSLRRQAILASTPFDLPLHRWFMNTMKEIWRVVGPPAFVVFTVWEVYYFMNHFFAANTIEDIVLLWGISLIIEIPFMVATYDQSERRERAAERRARGEPATLPGAVSSLFFWCLLAAVNVAGQIAFLAFVTHAGYSLASPVAVGLWAFILLRVTGVLVGDCYTAFHLLPTEATIDRVLLGQQAQMEGEARLSASDARRLQSDAESKRAVRQVQLSVSRDEREAQFMEDWQTMNMTQTLNRQRRFVELEQHTLQQLPGGAERDMGDL
jgi:hypothetical protein